MMRNLCLVLGMLTLPLLLLSNESPTKSLNKWDKSSLITVPDGYTIEQVAGPPLVGHPMMACFDDKGRLYIAEAAGTNLRADDLLKNPPNFIRRLEDTNGDGHFDKSTIFADKMTFPMGVLWYRGALYTASPPSLWRLEDTNDDGISDKREEFVTKFGFTGNAADIHGPFLHPSGWIYWADGRHGHEIARRDGKILKGKAARIFRCRPDGTDVEVVCGGGMDNPVEVVFTPEGEALANVNIFHNRPRIDALIHCIEGGAYPWHKVQEEFPQTGELLPAINQLGWVATSGFTRIRSTTLGKEQQGALFSTLFNRNRIRRHTLKRVGASFQADNQDFIICSDHDFHPTDVLEDADGSLLIVDTGGWFRIGCPSSRIAKPQIKGGIYRLRPKKSEAIKDPRGLSIAWKKLTPKALIPLLDDERFMVRDRAIDELAQHQEVAVPVLRACLKNSQSVRQRRNAVWTLTRMDSKSSRQALREALNDKILSVRLAATHALGLMRDSHSHDTFIGLLIAEAPELRREAATALGRIKAEKAIPALLHSLVDIKDRFLEHALIYAMIVIDSPEKTSIGLAHAIPQVQRGALIALDQMSKGKLSQKQVAPFLSASDSELQQTALKIFIRHPEWAASAVKLLRNTLTNVEAVKNHRDSLERALLAFAAHRAVQKLITDLLQANSTPRDTRLLLLETLADASVRSWPKSWDHSLRQILCLEEEELVLQAIVAIRSQGIARLDDSLKTIAENAQASGRVRLTALDTLAPRLNSVSASSLKFLLTQLHPTTPAMERFRAARIVDTLPLSKNQNSESVRKLAEPILQRFTQGQAEQRAKLKRLATAISGGNAGRGRSLFFGNKAACSACHAVKGQGEQLGPDLSTIGSIRSGQDLLESIVVPSSSFARGYEPFVFHTKQGRVFTGTLGQESATTLTIITADRQSKRLARDDIETVEPGKVSMMPTGLDEQLSVDELRDLLAYLQSLK